MDNALLNRQVVFFAGKGGVGKSTSAAAFALYAADQDRRVLLVSTDPAHNLADLFHTPIGGEGITRVAPNLDAVEVDVHRETHRYLDGVKENIRRTVRSTMLDEALRQIDLAAHSPGAAEAALFDRMVSLILEESQAYDLLVFDTAPTGHTVRLLTLPELMGTWVDGLLKRRHKRNRDYSHWLGDGEVPDDPLYDVLSRRRQRAAAMRDILLDDQTTAFVFVLVPEYLPITETRNAIRELADWNIHVRHLVVNKLLPEGVTDPFFRERLAREHRWLARIDEYFPDLHPLRLPLLPGDVDSREALDQVAREMARALDPGR
ncbi:ArsA family ATPase [Alkalilimnicola ehrlichii MLHE-1]|uniref:arsenite-transporting ATPase n=1 Tax=Alkalilimnicola ehrlichii (strain ATCC BAA-1101 / DSM 17681 / MLHE-1) TaxID=187272 RepID=Q0ABX0_ALKEH|nr:ArsA family ATPase [Alkalilimnicola ehrlichii]ABI55667.1 arsenite efflux ATP-binding protein ArsA [Alkalilimnicola ehrlichii MLHE-1]